MPLKKIDRRNIMPFRLKDTCVIYDDGTSQLHGINVIDTRITELLNDDWYVFFTTFGAGRDVINEYIFNTYGQKVLSDNLINQFEGWQQSDYRTLNEIVLNLTTNTLLKNREMYKRMFEAMTAEFNPLWNVDGVESTTRTLERDGTESTRRTGTDATAKTGTETIERTGTDATAKTGTVGVSESTSDTNVKSGTETDSHTGTDTNEKTGTETVVRTGTDTTTKSGNSTTTTTESKTSFNSATAQVTNVNEVLDQPDETDQTTHNTTDTTTHNVTNLETRNYGDQKTYGNVTDARTITASETTTNNTTDTTTHNTEDETTYNTNDTTTHNTTDTLTLDTIDTERITHERHGNIGVTKSTELVRDYWDTARYMTFIDSVCKDVLDSFTLSTY